MQRNEEEVTQEPTQAETAEPQEVEQQEKLAQEEQQPETDSLEAKEESGEGEPQEEGEEPKGDETQASRDSQRRKNGYQRKLERLERMLADKDALISRLVPNGQPQTQTPAEPQDPLEQTRAWVKQEALEAAKKLLAEEKQAAANRQLEQKWDEQLSGADEEEAYEVRNFIGNLRQSQAIPQALKEALLTSEYAPKIVSELLRNPVELARLDALPPAQAAREIGRFEAKLAAGAAPASPKPKPAVRPPAPPTKTGGTASSARSLDDLPLSEYKRAMRSGRR